MSTALQLVNKVLRRLREDEVSSLSSSYSNLILDFINETKREVEDAWNWSSLRTTKTVTTVASTRQYSITGAGNRFRLLDAWNTTQKYPLSLANFAYLNQSIESGSLTVGPPTAFRFAGQDSSGDPYIDLLVPADGVYTLTFYLFIPQTDLVNATDTLTVPEWPIVLGAWAKAISERGEDGGQNTIEQHSMYIAALGDAIAMDEARTVGEVTWQQV